MGLMAMEIAQRTRVIGAQVFKFRKRSMYGDRDFRKSIFGKRLIDHGFEMW